MFNYCPSCASKKIEFNINVFRCPDCGLVYYHNTAAANCCLITIPPADSLSGDAQDGAPTHERLLVTVRGKDPGKGLLDLPGGFVDPGEGILEGLYRELREEIGWVPPIPAGKTLADVFKFFASFPNVYPYKGFNYNTCDMYFTVSAPGLSLKDLQQENAHPEDAGEIAEVRFLKPEEININQFAFESVKRAVKEYTARQTKDRLPSGT